MTDVRTWLKFLTGDREAILRIARDRGAIWIGLLFVLSAGFAREYDGEDLLREPWHVLIPIAASIVISLMIFVPFWFRIEAPQRPPLAAAYRAFLTLFWMTAPMAWLYAIPYERLLSAPGSVRANMWTLAFVAVWRVVLISRVMSVLTGRSLHAALFVVLMISDIAVQVAISFVPVPIMQFMGGVRLTESDLMLQGTTFLLRIVGILGLLILVPATLLVLFGPCSGWRSELAATAQRPRGPLLYVAIASLVVWVGILPLTQPEQQRRRAVERELYAGRIASAISMMSAHPRDAFPPHWDPPPRIGYPREEPPLLDVMEVLVDGRGSEWVRAAYLDKVARSFFEPTARYVIREEQWARARPLIERLPEGPALLKEYDDEFSWPGYHPTTSPATQPFVEAK